MVAQVQDKRSGFAVVTALLILVVVGALAVGAFYMTSINIRLAQNSRAQAVAKYNAELWLDVALIAIADGYVALHRMPTLDELEPFLIGSSEYEVSRYWVSPSGRVGEIQVTGIAPRGSDAVAMARHPVSARYEGVDATSESKGGPGFITPGSIGINGASNLLINMHAGQSLKVSGNVSLGDPVLGTTFSFKSGTGDCDLGTAGKCMEDQEPPKVDPVDWKSEYDAAWAEYCVGQTVPSLSNQHNKPTVITIQSSEVGRVLCLPESGYVEISGGPLRDVTIVGGKDTVVTLKAASERNPAKTAEPADLALRIIAGDIVLAPEKTLSDRNIVTAHGNVILNRSVTQTETVETDEDGVKKTLVVVKTLIKAGNDVVFSGSGGSGTYAQIVANGKFCRNGNGGAKFVGTIIAKAGTSTYTNLKGNDQCGSNAADIEFNGGGNWTASLPDEIDTDYGEVDSPSGIMVTARRP